MPLRRLGDIIKTPSWNLHCAENYLCLPEKQTSAVYLFMVMFWMGMFVTILCYVSCWLAFDNGVITPKSIRHLSVFQVSTNNFSAQCKFHEGVLIMSPSLRKGTLKFLKD